MPELHNQLTCLFMLIYPDQFIFVPRPSTRPKMGTLNQAFYLTDCLVLFKALFACIQALCECDNTSEGVPLSLVQLNKDVPHIKISDKFNLIFVWPLKLGQGSEHLVNTITHQGKSTSLHNSTEIISDKFDVGSLTSFMPMAMFKF